MLRFALALLLAGFPEPVRKLIDLALANPPEIAADALIRISVSAGSREGAIDLLERAAVLARSAAHPYPRRGGLFYIDLETDAGRLIAALRPGVVRHSLEVRAARALLKLDPRRGTDAFSRIQPPQFPPLTCKDALGWRSEEYYELVTEFFERGFTEHEKREGKHAAMLEDQVRALTSPFLLYPLTQLLARVQVTPAQFERLVAVYATALKSRPEFHGRDSPRFHSGDVRSIGSVPEARLAGDSRTRCAPHVPGARSDWQTL